MSSNWMELGLSAADEEFVRRNAELYRKVYVETIDTVFDWAKAIEILRRYHKNSGTRGSFAAALVQYGFTARDGGPMNKAIVSHFKGLHDNEQAVRAWWASVPDKKKRDWLSAKAIYSHWQASFFIPKDTPRPAAPVVAQQQPKPDPSEATKLKEDNARLRRENEALRNAALDDTAVPAVESVEDLHDALLLVYNDLPDLDTNKNPDQWTPETLAFVCEYAVNWTGDEMGWLEGLVGSLREGLEALEILKEDDPENYAKLMETAAEQSRANGLVWRDAWDRWWTSSKAMTPQSEYLVSTMWRDGMMSYAATLSPRPPTDPPTKEVDLGEAETLEEAEAICEAHYRKGGIS